MGLSCSLTNKPHTPIQVDRRMKTATLLIGIFAVTLANADKPALPVLYRVDQPNSNVVVFRGADVARARAAGLLPGGPVKASPPVAVTPAPYVPPTTTPYVPPPPVPPKYKPAPVVYKPAPVVYKPAPIVYKPAATYKPYVDQYADVPAVYTWEYAVQDDYTSNNFGAKEGRDGYLTNGKYYVNLPDGRP